VLLFTRTLFGVIQPQLRSELLRKPSKTHLTWVTPSPESPVDLSITKTGETEEIEAGRLLSTGEDVDVVVVLDVIEVLGMVEVVLGGVFDASTVECSSKSSWTTASEAIHFRALIWCARNFTFPSSCLVAAIFVDHFESGRARHDDHSAASLGQWNEGRASPRAGVANTGARNFQRAILQHTASLSPPANRK